MSIRVLKLKSNNKAYKNRVNSKKMLALSYVKKGCCPESKTSQSVNKPIRSLSYHNYIKTAHNYKKYAAKSSDQKCCTSNGKLVKKVKQLTYKRSPETCSSSHVLAQKLNTLSCVKNDRKECSLPTKLMCLDDRPINRGRNACSKSINKISQGSLTNFKKVKTYQFVSASDHINSVNAERKKANGTKYESDLMLNPLC